MPATGPIKDRCSSMLSSAYPYLAPFSLAAGLHAIVGLDLLPTMATFILLSTPGWATSLTRRYERPKLKAAAALVIPATTVAIALLLIIQIAPQVRPPGPDTPLIPYEEAPKLVVGLLLALNLISFNQYANRNVWPQPTPTQEGEKNDPANLSRNDR